MGDTGKQLYFGFDIEKMLPISDFLKSNNCDLRGLMDKSMIFL